MEMHWGLQGQRHSIQLSICPFVCPSTCLFIFCPFVFIELSLLESTPFSFMSAVAHRALRVT